MNEPRRMFPSNFSEVCVNINRLQMKTSFDCQIKAVVQTNAEKKSTQTINFSSKHGQAIFSERITLFSNPKVTQTLKVTLLIVKQNTTKMVGVVNLSLMDDPVANSGLDKYSLDKCPIPDVKFLMTYTFSGQSQLQSNGYC